jgi:hypothetical protein
MSDTGIRYNPLIMINKLQRKGPVAVVDLREVAA